MKSGFEIPALFSFRPFSVLWEIRMVELMGWVEVPKPSTLGLGMVKTFRDPSREGDRVVAHIEKTVDVSGMLGLNSPSPCVVELDRSDIPSDILRPRDSRKTMPDISGHWFPVLVCPQPGFSTLLPANLKPGDAERDAWAMCKEFLNLKKDDDFDWVLRLQRFLNKWGLWNYGLGFRVESGPAPFLLALPHLLKQRQEEFRKALLPRSAHKWLSTAPPLSFRTLDVPPYFLVERFCCEEAIQATITIDHLRKRRWGFCKRCGAQFERDTEHKKNFCSRRCINAAGVKRWRERQRKQSRKGARSNAKG